MWKTILLIIYKQYTLWIYFVILFSELFNFVQLEYNPIMGKINIGKIYKLKINNNATFVIKGDDILEHKATFAKSDRAFVFFTNADVVYFFSSMPVNINNETQTLMDLFNQVNKDSSIYTEETIESFAKARCSIMFAMRPDAFDTYFEVCADEKEQFIPPLVYDAAMRFMNSNMDKIKYPIVVPDLS